MSFIKNNHSCLKCSSKNVRKVKYLVAQVQKRAILPKYMNPYLYVCTECGYSEIWVESKEELKYIEEMYES